MFISIKKSFATICVISAFLISTNALAFDFKDIFSSEKTTQSPINMDQPIVLNHKTTLKEARKKAKNLRNSFNKSDFTIIKKTIDTERKKGYHTWNHGSATSFYLYYLSSTTSKETNLLIDLGQSNLWIDKSPNSSYAYSMRGSVYAQLGWDARGTKYASDTPQYNMDKMEAYFKSAYEDLFKAIELDKKNAYAWRKVIQMSRHNMSNERKKFIFESAREILPNYYYTYYDYMKSLEPKWGGSKEELFAFARNKAFPEHIRSRLTLEAHRMWARHEDIHSNEFDENGLGKRKYFYLQEEDVKGEVAPIVERTLKKYPTYTQLHMDYASNLWYSRQSNDKKDEAKSFHYYSNAVDLNPLLVGMETTYWLANKYRKLRSDKKTAKYYEKYVTAFPDNEDTSQIHTAADFTGWYYSRLGDFRRAEPFYKIVANISPESAKAQANYCNALYNVYKYDEGIKHCEIAIEINAEHSWSYHILSEIYKKQGLHQKSQEFDKKYRSFETH